MKKRNATCMADDCGRRQYSRGYCQTHHAQFRVTGQTVAIRPYRPRDPNRIKYAGLRLTKECVARLKKYAGKRDLSAGAAIADILEQWHLTPRSERE